MADKPVPGPVQVTTWTSKCHGLKESRITERFRNARIKLCKNFELLLENIIQPCCKASSFKLSRQTSQDMKFTDLKKQLVECNKKACDIIPILQRDKLKAVVFGCTSSGKSTLINALLGEDVLPTNMGVCSSCLVQIEGCEEQEPYLTLLDGIRRNVEDLEELGNELDAKHCKAGEVITVHWPKSKCELLNNEIQIIDRPGISSDKEVDKIVNAMCADADVHIFVVDSVSSITTESREYFISVAKKLSKPNIIFVFNKWDESAYTKKQERNQQIRQQHVNTAKDLMKEGLNVEVENKFDTKKIFFVSAREILWAKTPEPSVLRGHSGRKEEFQKFLKELQRSVSAHAIKTKCGPHCNEGIALCDRMDGLAQEFLDSIDLTMKELLEENETLEVEVSELKETKTKFKTDHDNKRKQAKTKLKSSIKEKKDELRKQLDQALEDIPFEEDEMVVFKEKILKTVKANDDKLQDTLEKAVTKDLADIKGDIEGLASEGLADTWDDIKDNKQIPGSTSKTRFKLSKPGTTLSTAAVKDFDIDTPSYTDNFVWFRRQMSSYTAKITTIAGSGVLAGVTALGISTGVGAGVLMVGSGVICAAKYLEYNRLKRRQQILETIMENCQKWLDQHGKDAQNTCLNEADEFASNTKSTFDRKINRKLSIKQEIISCNGVCIKLLVLASEYLENQKAPLQTVKKHFQEFHTKYLQDNNEDDEKPIDDVSTVAQSATASNDGSHPVCDSLHTGPVQESEI